MNTSICVHGRAGRDCMEFQQPTNALGRNGWSLLKVVSEPDSAFNNQIVDDPIGSGRMNLGSFWVNQSAYDLKI